MELKKSNIILIEDTHTYLDGNGKNYEGITSTLIKAIFGDYTKFIPKDTLEAAQQRGTFIHESIATMESGFDMDIYEVNEYKRLRDAMGLVPYTSEYIVSDFRNFASPIDKVYVGDIIADIKTTSALHMPQVTFQLSWYAAYFEAMNGRPVAKAYAIWLPKPQYGECEFREVPLVAPAVIQEIVQAYLRHEDVTRYASLFGAAKSEAVEASRLPVVINNIASNIIAYERQLSAIKKICDEYKEQYKAALIEYFVQSGEKKIEYEGDTITYIAPTTRVSIDGKGLKADHPEIYKQYMKETVVGESIRIKLK